MPPDAPEGNGRTLGVRLRELRTEKTLGLREVAARAGVNHGYLSQLERGDVAQPAPAVLQKLSKGYDVPFPLLMDWAGYMEAGLSATQERALSYLGDDISDEELELVRAFLDAVRTRRATFALNALDRDLADDDIARIRGYVIALLRRADAVGTVPTPIDQVMEVARLVSAGEVTLDPEEKRRLRGRFGDLVDRVWSQLQGVIHFGAREIWVNPEMYPLRKRFVYGHEIGHYVLPEHRELFAYLDDDTRLKPNVRDLFERQANQAAIELLAQGDALRCEADDSLMTLGVVDDLASRFAISMQATARRVVEETRQECALTISFRAGENGPLMPPHLYCSKSFEQRFRWKETGAARALVARCALGVARGQREPLVVNDATGRAATIELDGTLTPRAAFTLFRAVPEKRRALQRLAALSS